MAATKLAKAVAMNCWRWQKTAILRPPTAADFLAGAATVLLHPVILQIESNGHSVSFGRMDQYRTRIIVATLNSTRRWIVNTPRDAA